MHIPNLLRVAIVPVHADSLEVGLYLPDRRLLSPRLSQVLHTPGVHREVAHGGAVLGTHVGDGRAVRYGQTGDSRPVELDELADHSDLSEVAGDGEDEVCAGGEGAQLSFQLVPHHSIRSSEEESIVRKQRQNSKQRNTNTHHIYILYR